MKRIVGIAFGVLVLPFALWIILVVIGTNLLALLIWLPFFAVSGAIVYLVERVWPARHIKRGPIHRWLVAELVSMSLSGTHPERVSPVFVDAPGNVVRAVKRAGRSVTVDCGGGAPWVVALTLMPDGSEKLSIEKPLP